MKTTLDLPAALFHRLEQAAAASGTSPEQFIVQTLERNLCAKTVPDRGNDRVRLPLIESKKPGTLHLTNADIEELLA